MRIYRTEIFRFPGNHPLHRGFPLQKQGIAKGLYLIQFARKGTVQVVFAVVGFQLVGLAAHVEHGVLDAVGVPAHERAAAGTAGRFKVLDVIGVGVVAQHHIHRPALGGHPDILDDTAVVQHTDRQPPGFEMMYSLIFSPFGVMPKGLERNCAIGLASFCIFWGQHTLCFILYCFDYITIFPFCVGIF